VTVGTDMSSAALQLVGLGLAAVLTFLTIYRMLGGREKTPRNIPRPTPASTASAEVPPAVSEPATVAMPTAPPVAPPVAPPASEAPPSVR